MSMQSENYVVRKWTPEMDAEVAAGLEQGLSARLIGEKIGVSRNAVLGRCFRLGTNSEVEIRKPTVTARAAPRAPRILMPADNSLSVDDIRTIITALRKEGHSWERVAVALNVCTATAKTWAGKLGIYDPKPIKRFTREDRAYVCEAWGRNITVQEMANVTGHSFGVVRQYILVLQRKGEIGPRDPFKTRLLRQYGEGALNAASTPREALKMVAEAKTQAFAAQVNAARAAKRSFIDRVIAKMKADLESGVERNRVIFEARAAGVNLEEIAGHFDLTRERVRQVCNAYAQSVALINLQSRVG